MGEEERARRRVSCSMNASTHEPTFEHLSCTSKAEAVLDHTQSIADQRLKASTYIIRRFVLLKLSGNAGQLGGSILNGGIFPHTSCISPFCRIIDNGACGTRLHLSDMMMLAYRLSHFGLERSKSGVSACRRRNPAMDAKALAPNLPETAGSNGSLCAIHRSTDIFSIHRLFHTNAFALVRLTTFSPPRPASVRKSRATKARGP